MDSMQEHSSEPKVRIFVSYSRKDMAFADRLEAALKARGFEPLIDRTEVCAFEDWWKRIDALIGRPNAVLFALSPDAVISDVPLKQVAHAAAINKRFAPIVCKRAEDNSAPEPFRRLNFIFFEDHPERVAASADQLAEALQTNIRSVTQHIEYGEAARRWSAAGRPSGLLLHSPTLEVAEHWIISRPPGAPKATEEIQAFVAESRQGVRFVQRRRQLAQVFTYTLLIGIIIGLVGWINQSYIQEQWNWYTTLRPFAVANFWPYVLTGDAERALKPQQSFRECAKDCPEMIVVPAGAFTMGSLTTEQGRYDNEGPQHEIMIAKPFAVSKFEVTFADWDACVLVGGCLQVSDSGMGYDTKPVINVSWDDAQRYVAWLSRMTGKPYRLLTEAEWEYAARAGSTTAYYWGDEIGKNNAVCNGCGSRWDGELTSPVGSFSANQFGLYDTAGNVWQWTQDCYHNNYNGAPTDGSAWTSGDCSRRVVRGGSWDSSPQLLRSAGREANFSGSRVSNLGFRVGKTLLSP